MKYYVALLTIFFSSYSIAKTYSFPQTKINISTKKALYTDQQTGGLIPADKSFQFLAFEFDHTQPNNLMIRTLKETWKKAGQKLLSEKDIVVDGFWGQEIRTSQISGRTTSYSRNFVFGDFYKVAQISIVCALQDPVEHCKGSQEIIDSVKWGYKSKRKLVALRSNMFVPEEYKLYLRVNTKKGPVLMYTINSEPMSSDAVPALTFAINKGALDTKKFLMSFSKSIDLTNLNPQASGIITKRTKDKILYSWGQRTGKSKNYYLSCGSFDKKGKFQLMACATGDQENYKKLHKAMHYMATQ